MVVVACVAICAVVLALGAGLRPHDISPGALTSAHLSRAAGKALSSSQVAALLRMIAVALAGTALLGALMARLGQPRVIGEILAGILLGPSLLGALAPGLEAHLLGEGVRTAISELAQLALALFAFQLGMELDLELLRRRTPQVGAIAALGVAIPLAAGMACGLATFRLVGPSVPFAGYAMFVGAAMSITALPVLARILLDRGLTATVVGRVSMGAAAIGDLIGWLLVALATALTHRASPLHAVRTLGLALALAAVMLIVMRPLLKSASTRLAPAGAVTLVTVALALACAMASEAIGVSVIFGGLLAGACMPRKTVMRELVLRDVKGYSALLLPLFFAASGLSTDVRLLGRPELLAMTVGVVVVAAATKSLAAFAGARMTGMPRREASTVGVLMDTRGLTELAVLSVALTAGGLSPAMYAALVVMALVTTAATGPLLRLLGVDGGTPAADEQPGRVGRL